MENKYMKIQTRKIKIQKNTYLKIAQQLRPTPYTKKLYLLIKTLNNSAKKEKTNRMTHSFDAQYEK